jgi:glycerol-3-phosphate acyltransferase PlsX
MKKKIDHTEVGGAPLLGVNGAVFISHGSSDARSIKSALRAAKTFIESDVNGHIKESLAKLPTTQSKAEEPGFWSKIRRTVGLVGDEKKPEGQSE